jgi:hypothetical protein
MLVSRFFEEKKVTFRIEIRKKSSRLVKNRLDL